MITGDSLKISHDPTLHAAYVGSWVHAATGRPADDLPGQQ